MATIVAILAAHVTKAEAERARTRPPNNWRAYDYYLQAAEAFTSFVTSFGVEAIYEARRLQQLSLAIDPNYVSLSQIKSEHIDDEVHPGLVGS